jgi:hypothetical protein
MGDVIPFKPKPKKPVVPQIAKELVIEAYNHLREAERLMAQANAIADAAGIPKEARLLNG